MVQTASTSEAAQSQVRGATAVRVLGGLLILQGGYRVYGAINTAVLVTQRGMNPSSLFLFLILSGVIGVLTIVAGVLLVRQDRAGRGFGLVVCSIALAHQVFAFGSTLVALSRLSSTTVQSLGVLFWLLPCTYAILFLSGIIVIARWQPPLR
jgi:hypothetical protein